MKIRCLEKLSDIIDADMSWRRKELTDVRFLVDSADDRRLNASIRQAVLLLYAHWEGFVKNCAGYYLNYIGFQKIRFKELPLNLMALVLRQELRSGEDSGKIQLHMKAVEKILTDGDRIVTIPSINQINAESNLKYAVFEGILLTLGLDDQGYCLKENLIDEQLLKRRNSIAHGENVLMSKMDYMALHDEILAMLNLFKTDVENSACLQLYKKAV